jgi:hypothetical protein
MKHIIIAPLTLALALALVGCETTPEQSRRTGAAALMLGSQMQQQQQSFQHPQPAPRYYPRNTQCYRVGHMIQCQSY